MSKAEKIIFDCGYCGKTMGDYMSNRKKSKTGKLFCSPSCRVRGVAVYNSIRLGGDGILRPKPEKDSLYYIANASVIRARVLEYYKANRLSILVKKKAKDLAFKQTIVEAYGGKCVCCGETGIEFLTIDHINGDGNLHRRKVGKKRIYEDLIRLGFPKDNFRLLCFNCNIVRGFYGFCPHHPEEKSNVSHVPFNPGRKRTVEEVLICRKL